MARRDDTLVLMKPGRIWCGRWYRRAAGAICDARAVMSGPTKNNQVARYGLSESSVLFSCLHGASSPIRPSLGGRPDVTATHSARAAACDGMASAFAATLGVFPRRCVFARIVGASPGRAVRA